MDHLGTKYAVRRQTVSQMGAAEGAIGAVNGDFFDISDTGAALGPAVDRERGVLQGPATGWIPENATFYLDATGYHVGPMVTRTKLRQRPRWPVSGLNAATVADNTLGLYTSDWGWTKGYSVTDGDKDVREVVVVNGRIRSNKAVLSKGRKVKGQVVSAAARPPSCSSSSRSARKATFKYQPKPGATMAVSGDRSILLDGVRTVVNDRLLHPRTAVGIDTDGQQAALPRHRRPLRLQPRLHDGRARHHDVDPRRGERPQLRRWRLLHHVLPQGHRRDGPHQRALRRPRAQGGQRGSASSTTAAFPPITPPVADPDARPDARPRRPRRRRRRRPPPPA